MKKIFTLLFLFVLSLSSQAQWVTIPDTNFVAKLQQLFPTCMIGNQMDTTCNGIVNATSLDVNGLSISSLEGVQYFDYLDTLWCINDQLTSLPSLPSSLTTLDCSWNQLTSLPSLPNSLTTLSCSQNNLTSLPSLPDSLIYLKCIINNLTSLPSLPNSLTTLFCTGNQLTSLPNLPNALSKLSCTGNELTSLPSLPNSLINLECSVNQLTSLPSLPNSLTTLSCAQNNLTSLPSLPNSFTLLDCSWNQLTNLPSLPNSLIYLTCSSNQLTSLPSLPNSLNQLLCTGNQLTSLPSLPPVMERLSVQNNPNLLCLPPIQKITGTSPLSACNISYTGISCLPNVILHPNIASLPAIDTMPICDLFNPNGCQVGYNISGTIYKDVDELCSTTTDIVPVHTIKVQLTDSVNNLLQQVYTNSNGQYSFDTDLGVYNVMFDTILNPFVPLCPTSTNITSTLTVLDSMDTNLDFKVRCNNVEDLSINSIVSDSGIFRPARKSLVKINAGEVAYLLGVSCLSTGGGTLKVFYNGATEYYGVASGSLAPNIINGDTLIWNIADFSTITSSSFHIRFLTDSFPVIGSQVCVTAMISSDSTESNLSNNILTHCFTIVNSYDPNIKEVYPNQVQQAGETLTYTIHFQNTGTAEAEHIKVLDTLDANLDWNTFQLLGSSHENITQVYNTTGIVKFNFPNINLADSFSNEPASHGWVQYKIKMKDNIVPPVQIHNTASIYFDFNSPIVTNDAVTIFCAATSSNQTYSLCEGDSVVVGNSVYNSNGVYTDVLLNSQGCDSTVTSIVVVHYVTSLNFNTSICEGESYTLPDGSVTDSAGFYPFTFSSIYGCDSSSSIQISILSFDNSLTNDNNTLVANQFANSYQWIDCSNNQPINGATEISFTPAVNGEYAVVMTVGTCTRQSECVTITDVGLENLESRTLSIYPNPVSDVAIIESDCNSCLLRIIDMQGKIIYQTKTANYKTILNTSLWSNGLYIVELIDNDSIERRKLVKE